MAHRLSFFLILTIFSVSYCEDDTKSFCFSKNVLNSYCQCENLLLAEHMILPETETEAKLTCTGKDALKATVQIIQSQKHIVFIDVKVSNSSFQSVNFNDLQYFTAIKNLSLSDNNISLIDNEAFKDQKQLEVLDLSFNYISLLENNVFEELVNLKNLTISNNILHNVASKAFYNLHNLLYLDLSNNKLSSIDSNWFLAMKSLQFLFLGPNEIHSIELNSFHHLTHLQKLDLSFNKLKMVPSLTFYRLKNLRFLSLAMNELETLNESVFKGNNMLEKVNLTGNLWICDKKLLPLNDYLKKYEAYKEGAYCFVPPEFRNYTVQQGLDILNLELKIEENPTCNRSMCNCTISKDKLVVTVDCSSRGLEMLPAVVPYKTKVLNLYDNNIKSLTIDHIDATLWSDVSFLYLNNNVIDTIKGLEGTWLLRNLVALHISNNLLTEIPIHILEQFRGGLLDELYLSGNPWNCDCNTVRFQTWLQDNFRAVRNLEGICCSSASVMYSHQPIYGLKKSQLCPQQVQLVNYLDVLNSLMAIAIIIIIIKLSYDYWFQKRTGKLPRFFSLNLT